MAEMKHWSVNGRPYRLPDIHGKKGMQAVGYIRFTRPVLVESVGYTTELKADYEQTVDRPGGPGRGAPTPTMTLDPATGNLWVGRQCFNVAGPVIEFWLPY